jgi:hypothetical protein
VCWCVLSRANIYDEIQRMNNLFYYQNNRFISIYARCDQTKNAISYNTIQYNIIQCHTMPYNTIQCHTIRDKTEQYKTKQNVSKQNGAELEIDE